MTLRTYTTEPVAGRKPVRTGKVRDLYEVGENLLLVASDRVSAFDVVMGEPVAGKGVVLTAVSEFWFRKTSGFVRNHRITVRVDDVKELTPADRTRLRGRAMLCRKAAPYPFEFVVRGYLSGSGWSEYQKTRTICGIELPAGLLESSRLPVPILTPTTKAEQGHDEPVRFATLERELGVGRARELRELALGVFRQASEVAANVGILLADTKFEFGELEGRPALIDEVLTPDSSRFWPAEGYAPGGGQPSFDKQFLRDYLTSTGWNKTPPPPAIPDEVLTRTAAKYSEICQLLTGERPEQFAARV